MAMMSGQKQISRMGTSSTVTMARYLPRTMPVRETGEVSSSWSVLPCRSSAMERMVRMGTATMKMMVQLSRT